MSERSQVHAILRELDLPRGQWVLAGSGAMILHGIERTKPMGDVDIFLATRTWFDLYNQTESRPLPPDNADNRERVWGLFTTHPDDSKRRVDPPYLYRTMHGLEVNIFSSWRRRSMGNIDVAFWIHNAEEVEGWPCVRLQFLLDWKRTVGRAKDVDDIRLLEQHLGGDGG